VIVSLFIFLVLCTKGIKLPATAVLFIIYWASWSDRPFMGDEEEELNLALSIKML
jgi:hypothetical protein